MLKLASYLKPYKGYILITFLLLFFQTLAMIYIPTLTANLINIGIVNRDIVYIRNTGLLMLGVALGGGFCAVIATWLSSKVSSLFAKQLRILVFTKSQMFSSHDFDKFGTSSMITRSTNDIMQIQQGVLMMLQFILPVPLMMLAGLSLAFSKDAMLALLLVGVLVLFVVYGIFIGKQMIPLSQKMQVKMDNINRIALENLSGVRVIRAFNKMAFQKVKFDKTVSDYAFTAIKLNKVYAFAVPFVMLVMNVTLVLILWIGGTRAVMGITRIGDIMAFIEYSVLILMCLNMGVMTVIFLFRAGACAVRVNEVLNIEPEITKGIVNKVPTEETTLLEFRKVTFGYPGAVKPVLSDLNFRLKTGEITAVIGGTGSGKSTIASLIPRFHEIQEGSILINGFDIKVFPQKELRDQVGYVPQKAFLFSGTIEENIKYGNKNATKEEVEYVAKIAQAHDFISKLPNGYQYYVAQEGCNLSGGQKQRIAIARALAKKAKIYIFDDSFSALDFKTDANLRKELKQELNQSIIFLVAQRVSTIMDADQILVLDEGKIVGTGTHQELLSSCPIYRQIVKSQQSSSMMGE